MNEKRPLSEPLSMRYRSRRHETNGRSLANPPDVHRRIAPAYVFASAVGHRRTKARATLLPRPSETRPVPKGREASRVVTADLDTFEARAERLR